MQMECQRIIFHFLLPIFHKFLAIYKRCPLPYFPLIFAHRLVSLSLLSWSTVIGGYDLHNDDRGNMMLVLVHTEERGYMMT